MAAGRGAKGLAALLAAAGLYQIVDWVRAGIKQVRGPEPGPRLSPGAGEIHLDTGGERWDLIADLQAEAGQVCWLLLEGPRSQVAAATSQTGLPLAFSLEPGPPGIYRFWVFGALRGKETVRSLSRKLTKALAAGEFRTWDPLGG